MKNATKKAGGWSAVRQQLTTWEKPALLALVKDLYEAAAENRDHEEREYPNATDQTREVLIHENYLSQADINICLGFDIAGIAGRPEINSVIRKYQKEYQSPLTPVTT